MPIDKQKKKDDDNNTAIENKEVDDVFGTPPILTVTDATLKDTKQNTEPHEVRSSIGRINSKLRPSVALSSSVWMTNHKKT